MKNLLLDFTHHSELRLHAQIVADFGDVARSLGIEPLIVGAFARDLHLLHGHNIQTLRQTEDVDFALAVPDWRALETLQDLLEKTVRFSRSATSPYRLRHQSGLPIDLIPFGGIENSERKVIWPPRGDVEMDVFGFREAQVNATDVRLPGGVFAQVVSLPALGLLKIVCWCERHDESPRKDAQDLMLIVSNYLLIGNQERLFEEFVEWTQEVAFDYEMAGARMLGFDLAS